MRSFHRNEGEKALKGARAVLNQEKLAYECHIAVGAPAEAIVAYSKQKGCAGIVIGTRGLSALPGLLLGSGATRVLHMAEVPVTLIPRKRGGSGLVCAGAERPHAVEPRAPPRLGQGFDAPDQRFADRALRCGDLRAHGWTSGGVPAPA